MILFVISIQQCFMYFYVVDFVFASALRFMFLTSMKLIQVASLVKIIGYNIKALLLASKDFGFIIKC